MKQSEATESKPFFSVAYQYATNPWTLFSYNFWPPPMGNGTGTKQGTDDLKEAIQAADWLVTKPGIAYAQVSKTTDCYNHTQVYKTHEKATDLR